MKDLNNYVNEQNFDSEKLAAVIGIAPRTSDISIWPDTQKRLVGKDSVDSVLRAARARSISNRSIQNKIDSIEHSLRKYKPELRNGIYFYNVSKRMYGAISWIIKSAPLMTFTGKTFHTEIVKWYLKLQK